MKKRMARLAAVGLAAVMVCGLAACGSSTNNSNAASSSGSEKKSSNTAASKNYKIGLVIKTATNAHFQDIAYGAQLAAQDYGVTVDVLNTTTESDVEGQVKKCEDLISKGVDALILTPNDSKGVSSAVTQAHDQDVKFVAVDTTIDNQWGDKYEDYVPAYVGVNHVDIGEALGDAVAEKIGNKGDVVVIRGVDAASSSNDRTKGIKKALAKHSGIKIVAEQSGSYDTETAQTKVSNILQAHKNVKAIICCNDLMAMGAINACKDQGLTVGGDDGIVIAGIDGNVVGLRSIKSGELYATAYDWSVLQGYWAVYDAIEELEGNTVPENTVAPQTLITKDNVDKFLPHGEALAKWQLGDTIKQ